MTTSAGLVLLLLSWAAIWYGHVSVLALIVGILVLDLTVQGVHITNQTVIYRVKPDARNRLTARSSQPPPGSMRAGRACAPSAPSSRR